MDDVSGTLGTEFSLTGFRGVLGADWRTVEPAQMMCCSIPSTDPTRPSARESRLTFPSSSILLLSTLSDAGSADNKSAMQTNPSSFVSCVVNSSLNHVNICGSYRCGAMTRTHIKLH